MVLRPIAAARDPSIRGRARFTPAELRVLPLLATHLTLEGIAERLEVRRSTVKTHVVSIYKKLGVSTRAQAVERAEAGGFLPENTSIGARGAEPSRASRRSG